MAAPTLAQIRTGLANNLAGVATALGGAQASPYMLANPTPPALHVFPADVEYDLAMGRGLDRWTLTVQAFVGLTADQGAQVNLDKMLAPSGTLSVKTALESDSTLGGTVADVNVRSCSGYQVYVREGGPPVLGAEWSVEVLASGI